MLQSVTNGDTMDTIKPKRGQKLCKNCNNINGARSYICKHCNFEFKNKPPKNKFKKLKKKLKKYVKIDWKSLVNGDRIKVFKGGGNYYINDMGEKVYMSRPGVYVVQHLDDNGIIVYSNKYGGFGYIYMGDEVMSSSVENLYRSPHKIVKLNSPLNENSPISP